MSVTGIGKCKLIIVTQIVDSCLSIIAIRVVGIKIYQLCIIAESFIVLIQINIRNSLVLKSKAAIRENIK